MRRQSRLFALADYLRGRRTGVTAEQLAARFQVTVRTIYRDLDSLRDAALPLEAERGPGGGYALARGYTLPPLNFTPREAALLVVLGRWAREMRLVPFAETLEGALDKVRGALDTPAQRELLRQVDGLQLIGIPGAQVSRPVARAVEEAWFAGTPLRITYRDANGAKTERTIEIETVLMERSQTVLVCKDREKGEKRSFRLDRIEAAAPLVQS
jgi:predicted DNA-binding transcriptional regulator YafY